jgi:hypothetical protein
VLTVLPVLALAAGLEGNDGSNPSLMEAGVVHDSLPLTCYLVPGGEQQLCVVITQSPYGPYDEVVYYHKDTSGALALIGAEGGGVASFGGVTFSENGEYLWLSWAEEGHASVYFYNTTRFLEVGTDEGLHALHHYELDHVDGITADGQLIYGFWKPVEPCMDVQAYSIVADPHTCHHRIPLGDLEGETPAGLADH